GAHVSIRAHLVRRTSPDRGDDWRGLYVNGCREMADATYGETVTWQPAAPRFRVLHVLLFWVLSAVAVLVAGLIVPGVTVGSFGDALVAAILIAALNAVLPP